VKVLKEGKEGKGQDYRCANALWEENVKAGKRVLVASSEEENGRGNR